MLSKENHKMAAGIAVGAVSVAMASYLLYKHINSAYLEEPKGNKKKEEFNAEFSEETL